MQSDGREVGVVSKRKVYCDIEFISVYKPLREKIGDRFRDFKIGRSPDDLHEDRLNPREYDPQSRNFRRRIWYTPENVRPPIQNSLHGSLSFDQDQFGGKNLYCPSWYGEVGLSDLRFSREQGVIWPSGNLLSARTLVNKPNQFCSTNSGHLNSFHSHVISLLKEFGSVDTFSDQFLETIQGRNKVMQKYQFILCSEIDIYPGYVTKVLLQAYLAGAVPLYIGDLGNDSNINRKSFINVLDFPTLRDFTSYLNTIDDKTYRQIYEQPFLRSLPDVTKIRNLMLGI